MTPDLDLFIRPDGLPMTFVLSPSDSSERQLIKSQIEGSGGVLLDKPTGDYWIWLIRESELCLRKKEEMFSVAYIRDCVKENILLPSLSKYRVKTKGFFSMYANYDPLEVLLGFVPWSKIPKRMEAEGERVSGDELSQDMEDDIKVDVKAGWGTYNKKESRDILDWLMKQNAYSKVRGNMIWIRMEKEKVCGGRRTWQSMKGHFKTQIMVRIHSFGLDEDAVYKFIAASKGELADEEDDSRVADSVSSPSRKKFSETEDTTEKKENNSPKMGRNRKQVFESDSESDGEDDQESNKQSDVSKDDNYKDGNNNGAGGFDTQKFMSGLYGIKVECTDSYIQDAMANTQNLDDGQNLIIDEAQENLLGDNVKLEMVDNEKNGGTTKKLSNLNKPYVDQGCLMCIMGCESCQDDSTNPDEDIFSNDDLLDQERESNSRSSVSAAKSSLPVNDKENVSPMINTSSISTPSIHTSNTNSPIYSSSKNISSAGSNRSPSPSIFSDWIPSPSTSTTTPGPVSPSPSRPLWATENSSSSSKRKSGDLSSYPNKKFHRTLSYSPGVQAASPTNVGSFDGIDSLAKTMPRVTTTTPPTTSLWTASSNSCPNPVKPPGLSRGTLQARSLANQFRNTSPSAQSLPRPPNHQPPLMMSSRSEANISRPLPAVPTPGVPSFFNKPLFNFSEEKAIVDYFCKEGGYSMRGGHLIWKRMVERGVCPGRTWKCLRNRWEKIERNLAVFGVKEIDLIKADNEAAQANTLNSGDGGDDDEAPKWIWSQFTDAEEWEMINYFLKNGGYTSKGGNSIWMAMESDGVCPTRTWKSMKGRWRMKTDHNLAKFGIDRNTLFEADRGNMKKMKNSSGANYTAMEDMRIMRFLKGDTGFDDLNNDLLWKQMEEMEVVSGRSWQSMKDRYRNFISKNVSYYNF